MSFGTEEERKLAGESGTNNLAAESSSEDGGDQPGQMSIEPPPGEPAIQEMAAEDDLGIDFSIAEEPAEEPANPNPGKRPAVDDEEEMEEPEPKASFKDKLREKKKGLLFFVAAFGFIGFALSGNCNGKASSESKQKVSKTDLSDIPKPPVPRVREEPYKAEEMAALMTRAEAQERERRNQQKKKEAESKGLMVLDSSKDYNKMTREELLAEVLKERGLPAAAPETQASLATNQKAPVAGGGAKSASPPAVSKVSQKKGQKAGSSRPVAKKQVEEANLPTEEPSDSLPKRRKRPNLSGFYGSGGLIEPEGKSDKMASSEDPPLPEGLKLRVKNATGLSSLSMTTCVVEVVEDGKSEGAVVVPKGSKISGRPSARRDRIFIDFYKLVPKGSGKAISIRGYAVVNDMPGIPGTVFGKGLGEGEDPSGRIMKRSALRTGQTAVGMLVPGSELVSDLAKNVATEGLGEVGRSSAKGGAGYSTPEVQVKSGTPFDVVIGGE